MPEMRGRISRIAKTALELFWPRQAICLGCGDPSGADVDFLCATCTARMEEIQSAAQYRCSGCGNPAEAKCICHRMPHVDGARYAFYYQNPVRGLIRQLKYHEVTCQTDWMGTKMCEILLREGWSEDAYALVPVPMPAKRRRTRGFNQAELLALAVSKHAGIPVLNLLERTGETKRQVGLSREERLKNVQDAFHVAADVRGLKLLLIDDVRTTGATLEACAKTLKIAGASEVYALTFAAVCRPVEGETP